MSIFALSPEGADRLLGFSNTMLVIGLVVALAATIGTIWASSVIGHYSNIRQADTDAKVAAADARAAEATLAAAQANERSASLEKDTAELQRQAEEARAEAARVNERLHKLQEIRRLPADKAASLSELLRSEVFQKEPKPKIRVMSATDSEANIYAMDFLSLFKLHGISGQRYSDNDVPALGLQFSPQDYGLSFLVNNYENPGIAFVRFSELMIELGLIMTLCEDPEQAVNTASLAILRKPLVS
jgi:hypothetical protein